ncbi:MAG TPA: hypothetical protein VMU19_00085 [Bryobacteraceae bacterium]|nr:hypothetical protein [Bryobacteraceae bacterium]
MRATTVSGGVSRSGVSEHTLRLGVALIVLALQFEGMLGLAWDIQWHISVGRDRFWTPPHILLYTATAFRGLLAVAIVLWETWRFRNRSGVSERNSVPVFRIFHAPIGIVLVGFGALVTALAAPLDDYWHKLYGVDVTLWAPFHMMGTLGGFLANLGSIYLWASLVVARDREGAGAFHRVRQGFAPWTFERVCLAVSFMFMVGQMLTLSWPAQIEFPTLWMGTVPVMLYPVLLAVGMPWLFVAAGDTFGARGAASVIALVLLVREVLVQAFVPWAVHAGAAAEGLPFRTPALEPHFNVGPLVFNGGLLVAAIVADVSAHVAKRGGKEYPALRGLVLGLPLFLLAVWVCNEIWSMLNRAALPAEFPISTPPSSAAIWAALPVTLAVAALSGWIGGGLSQVWRRSAR